MVVDTNDRRWKARFRFFASAILIGAIGVDRGILTRRHGIRTKKDDIANEKLQATRNGIEVDADHFVTKRSENAGQRNQRTDTIAVRPGMTNKG